MHGKSCLMFCCVLLIGCGDAVKRLPDDPEKLVVFSIDGPGYVKSNGLLSPEQQKGELLYGYPVLGKVEVADAEQRRSVIRAIKAAALKPSKLKTQFGPRHAIRIINGNERLELMLSFPTQNYKGYREGKPVSDRLTYISSEPESLLDKMLTDSGVPIPPRVPFKGEN